MARSRKNKSSWVGSRNEAQDWFKQNVKRQRKRNKLAKASRKKNRG